MSKFFVGQRVRVKATDNEFLKHLVGAALVIVKDEPNEYGQPCWWVNAQSARGFASGATKDTASDYWEPILPEGMQPVAWEDCLWQPEGVAA